MLVLRLATANSVEGKMLRRANSKLMLEKLIIKRGAFLDHSADEKPSSMKADDLLELLRPDINIGDDAPQSGVVSDKVCPHRSQCCYFQAVNLLPSVLLLAFLGEMWAWLGDAPGAGAAAGPESLREGIAAAVPAERRRIRGCPADGCVGTA